MSNIIRKLAFAIISIFACWAAIHFSFFVNEPNYAMTAVWLTFSLFSFALGWPEVAKSITFLGSSVKTREVKAAATELKAIAKSLALVLLEGTQASGRWGGGFSFDRKQQLRKEVEASLEKSGFNPAEIEEVFSGWNRWCLFDYASAISCYAQKKFTATATKWENKHSTDFNNLNKPDKPATANMVRDFMRDNNFLDAEIDGFVTMMAYYEEHKNHRNPADWKNLKEKAWGHE